MYIGGVYEFRRFVLIAVLIAHTNLTGFASIDGNLVCCSAGWGQKTHSLAIIKYVS